MTTEAYAAIIEAVNTTGKAHVWRNQSGKVRARGGYLQLAPAGCFDIVGYTFRGGRFVGLEVKVAGARTGKLTAAKQALWLTMVQKAGGVAATVMTPAQAVAVILEAA